DYNQGVDESRNYGWGSPANGSTLSKADEDERRDDCHLWNKSGFSINPYFSYSVSFPQAHQAQVHFTGSASDPLEPPLGAITWDMQTVIDAAHQTASVTFYHTCYPAHQIKVNGTVVYNYPPPFNSTAYLVGCLTGLLPAITGGPT